MLSPTKTRLATAIARYSLPILRHLYLENTLNATPMRIISSTPFDNRLITMRSRPAAGIPIRDSVRPTLLIGSFAARYAGPTRDSYALASYSVAAVVLLRTGRTTVF